MAYIMRGREGAFQLGVDVLNKLAKGNIHLNLDASEIPSVFSGTDHANINKFSGPHPAGNVGVQIHHIKPIGKKDKVWTIDPLSVARIGTLFSEGIYDASKLIAITGSEVINPHYVKTYSGACLDKLVAENIKGTHVRFIAGNVLTGEHVGDRGYLGHFHNQISVIPEGDQEEFLGWLLPSFEKLSFHKAFGLFSFLSPKKEKVLDTNTNGEQRNFTISGAFEKILPMDILPTYLFKSIISNDYDEMEALGIYEVIEEDVALCEYIDVSKNDIQAIIREGIELIRNS
jgi:Na+-transporting NADH:ubiquinone oxidoreductase subunit A